MRLLIGLFLIVILVQAQPAQAQFAADEIAARKAYNSGVGLWKKGRDGDDSLTVCFIAWGLWSDTTRAIGKAGDFHGDLTHVFADGQLTHYAVMFFNRFPESEWNDRIAKNWPTVYDFIDNKKNMHRLLKELGKCYVDPNSWNFGTSGKIFTGPEFVRDILALKPSNAFPPHVKNIANRQKFDNFVLKKDFASAANHAFAVMESGDGDTIHWFELLGTSHYAISKGDGLKLDLGVLKHLASKWPDKGKRGMADHYLRIKTGRNVGRPSSSANSYGDVANRSRLPKEPPYVKQEYERYLRGQTNYTPCNMWHKAGC